MNYSLLQTDLFGNTINVPAPHNGLQFCVKMNYAEKSGLYYDLRLEIPEIHGKSVDTALAKSFAVKTGLSMNPHHKPVAVLVDDHKVSAFRREGTILRGAASGAVLHFDEGFFTVQGSNTPKEVFEAFHQGLNDGKLKVTFSGHKIKGEFHFYRKTVGRYSQWVIQKANDSFATGQNILSQNRSILSGHGLQHYLDIYYKQKQIMYKLSNEDLVLLHRKNDAASFQYKNKGI